MWAVVPAAGLGQRIQPIACSKELLPVGHRLAGDVKRPKAVSEYLLERLILAGVRGACFVISADKADIMQYFGERFGPLALCYVVQSTPRGFCDALFKALPLVQSSERVMFGLPDTIWFPEDALCQLPASRSSLLLFPVAQPQYFDAVLTDTASRVLRVEVKTPDAHSHWIWGAGAFTGADFVALHTLWQARQCADEYLGTLLNAFVDGGGRLDAVRAGDCYLDVGTFEGFQAAAERLNASDRRAG